MVEERIEPGRVALWISVVALSTISFLLVMGSIGTALDERPRDAYLIVEQVYFESEDVGSETYDLTVKAYVTNNGDRSAEVKVSAFAKEVTTNIVFDSATVELGKMSGKTTDRADMTIKIDAKRRYVIEVIAYKDGKVAVRGSGSVDLALAGVGAQDYKTTYKESPSEDGGGIADEAKDSLPFPALAAIVPIAVITAILIRRWKR